MSLLVGAAGLGVQAAKFTFLAKPAAVVDGLKDLAKGDFLGVALNGAIFFTPPPADTFVKLASALF